jgi:hypothetical protein
VLETVVSKFDINRKVSQFGNPKAIRPAGPATRFRVIHPYRIDGHPN